MALQDLMVATRSRCGDPTESELPDDVIARSLTSALREFSRFRPLIGWTSFNTVAGTSSYALPVGVTDVSEIWTTNLSSPGDPGLFELLTWDATGKKSWDEFLAELERYGLRPMEDAVWDWRVVLGNPPMLRLAPEPTSVFTVVCRTEQDVSDLQLQPEDEEHVIRYALALCYEYRATRRNQAVMSLPTAVGTVKLDNGQVFFDRAKELRAEFRDQLGMGATFVARG